MLECWAIRRPRVAFIGDQLALRITSRQTACKTFSHPIVRPPESDGQVLSLSTNCLALSQVETRCKPGSAAINFHRFRDAKPTETHPLQRRSRESATLSPCGNIEACRACHDLAVFGGVPRVGRRNLRPTTMFSGAGCIQAVRRAKPTLLLAVLAHGIGARLGPKITPQPGRSGGAGWTLAKRDRSFFGL